MNSVTGRVGVAGLTVLLLAGCDAPARIAPPAATSSPVMSAGSGVPRLAAASIAYDPGSRIVLLFGIREGDYGPTTWTWDGQSWIEQHPQSSPTIRAGSLAYDWATSSMLLFAATYPEIQSQVWSWKDGNWIQLHPTTQPTDPGAEYFFTFGSDARSRQVLAFGGCCAQSLLPSQTWSWDGSSWAKLRPTIMPSKRTGVNFVFDPAIEKLVLFGGYVNGSGNQSNDLWTWDGRSWVHEYPDGSPPADLANAAIGYDGSHKTVVLLARSGKYDVQTWTWDGHNWTQQQPAVQPPATVAYDMAWDEATSQLVLFDIVSVQPPQTWIWTGSNWERKS